MNDNDLNKIRSIVKEEVSSSEDRILGTVRGEISSSEERILGTVRGEISSSEERILGTVRGEIKSSEERILKTVKVEIFSSEERMSEKITSSENRVLGELGNFMENQLFPMLEEKADKSDIDRFERKLDILSDKVIIQEKTLRDIVSLPTIAHELKLKKSA